MSGRALAIAGIGFLLASLGIHLASRKPAGPVPPADPPSKPGTGVLPTPAHPAGGKPAPVARPSRFPAPEGWPPEAPASAMRLLQFTLPRADGDPEDGQAVVFWFGGGGGGVEENLERWRGQFANVVHGRDALEEITEDLEGRVTVLSISGQLREDPATEAHGGRAKGTVRMIAAVIEVPDGPYYVRVVGPEGTVSKWEKAARDFILGAAKKGAGQD